MVNQKKITKSGTVSIPVNIRRKLCLRPGDALDVHTGKDGSIVLTPHVTRCIFCGEEENAAVYNGKGICLECYEKIGKEIGIGGEIS